MATSSRSQSYRKQSRTSLASGRYLRCTMKSARRRRRNYTVFELRGQERERERKRREVNGREGGSARDSDKSQIARTRCGRRQIGSAVMSYAAGNNIIIGLPASFDVSVSTSCLLLPLSTRNAAPWPAQPRLIYDPPGCSFLSFPFFLRLSSALPFDSFQTRLLQRYVDGFQ